MINYQEIKIVFTMALPLMAAFMAQKGMQLIDSIMLGWLGEEALAAGALGTSLFITVMVCALGMLSSVGVFIARARGAQDEQSIDQILLHGLYLALLLSLPCMYILWIAPSILLSLGQSALVVENTKLFLRTLVWGFPGYFMFLVLREFASAFSLTRIVMFVTVSSLPLTFIFNYVLMYGKLGLPSLGIAGVGLSCAFVMWFMFASLFLFTKYHRHLKKYLVWSSYKIDFTLLYELAYVGFPSGILFVLESGMFTGAAIMMGYFGVESLAAHQIAMQCVSIAYAIPFALAMTTAIQVGHAAGENNFAKLKHIVVLNISMGWIITSILALCFILFANDLIDVFIDNKDPDFAELNKLAASLLYISALFQCFDGLQSIVNGALRGLKDTLAPMMISLAAYWVVGLGSAYLLAFHTSLRSKGVWYGLTAGLCTVSLVLLLRLIKHLRYKENSKNISNNSYNF